MKQLDYLKIGFFNFLNTYEVYFDVVLCFKIE